MPNTDSEHWGIVGGGVLGMTLALRLRQQGKRVTLLEATPSTGGLAAAWEIGGTTWDKHYHVTLLSDSSTRSILKELGLDDDMRWVETKTGFYTGDKHYSMSSSLEFLMFPPLSLIDKFRLGATIFYAARVRDWKKLETTTSAEWLCKLSGKSVFEKIWKPLLISKLGDGYDKASAAFIWAIIQRMYAARRSGMKKEMFGYLPGGYSRFFEGLEGHLNKEGVVLRINAAVERVSKGVTGVDVQLANGQETLSFDQVVLTVPSPVVTKICPDLSAAERSSHEGISYQGILCASVLLKKPLEGYYVTNITDDWVPFTAVIEMTALVEPEEIGGNYLVYLPRYVDSSDTGAFERTDEELREEFWSALQRMHPMLEQDDLVAFQVSRARHVLAISTIGYSESLPASKTSIPGVRVVNSALICNGTLNVNETIALADNAAQDILKEAPPE